MKAPSLLVFSTLQLLNLFSLLSRCWITTDDGQLTVDKSTSFIRQAMVKIHALEESRVLNEKPCDQFKIFQHLDDLISLTTGDHLPVTDAASQRIEVGIKQILGIEGCQKVIRMLQGIRKIDKLILPTGGLDDQLDLAGLEALCSQAANLLGITPHQLVMAIAYAPDPDTHTPRPVSDSKREVYRAALITKLYGQMVQVGIESVLIADHQNILIKLNDHLAGFCEVAAHSQEDQVRVIKLIDIVSISSMYYVYWLIAF